MNDFERIASSIIMEMLGLLACGNFGGLPRGAINTFILSFFPKYHWSPPELLFPR
jgi:hypothetical protein